MQITIQTGIRNWKRLLFVSGVNRIVPYPLAADQLDDMWIAYSFFLFSDRNDPLFISMS